MIAVNIELIVYHDDEYRVSVVASLLRLASSKPRIGTRKGSVARLKVA